MLMSKSENTAVAAQIEEHAKNLGGQIKVAGEKLKHAGDFEIEITRGAHADTKLNMKAGRITIGSSKTNDIVLFADDVAESHLAIEFPKKVFDKIKITPIDEAVSFADGDVVALGQYAEINSGDEINIGNSSLRISRKVNISKSGPTVFKVLAVIALLLIAPFLFTMVSGVVTSAFNSSYKIASNIGSSVIKPATEYALASNPDEAKLTEQFVWAVKIKLEDLKLSHKVTANAMDNGSIRIRGTIGDNDTANWNSFLYWYDQRKGFPTAVRDVKRDKQESDLPKVKSIWMEEPATAFFQDGTSATIGEKLWFDWVVVDITRAGVVLERDGSRLELSL